MRLALLFLFTALPLAEIVLLVKFGQWAGVWATLALVVGTGITGALVLQRQGVNVFYRIQESMMRGEPPVGPMIDGVMLGVAGLLLITPGLLSDATGLLLLVPPIRRAATLGLGRLFFGSAAEIRVETFETRQERRAPGAEPSPPPPGDGPIIEGEFERLDERSVDPHRRRDEPRS